MQNNSNISLERYDSATIAAISNQVLTTIFTKTETKVKLRTSFGNYRVAYKLSAFKDQKLDESTFKLENNVLTVTRHDEVSKVAKLAVYLLDGAREIYVSSWELNLLTSEQSNTYELQEMRYNTNKISYLCGMLGILFSLVAAIVVLNSAPYTWKSLFFILITIAIVLVGFLASEKTKTYKINYSYVMLALGIVCVLLVFWYPLSFIVNYNNFLEAEKQLALNPNDTYWTEVSNIAQSNLGTAIIGDGKTQAMLPQSGTFRGILSMVLFLIGAASFGFGSIRAYLKSKKLNKYLESLEER